MLGFLFRQIFFLYLVIKLKIMKIELIKDCDKQGQVTYYINVDELFVLGSIRSNIIDAIEAFNIIKEKHSKARTEVLMVEEI